MKLWKVVASLLVVGATSTQANASFVNGGFENGTTSGWQVGQGNRNGANFSTINPDSYLNGQTGRSAVVNSGLDPVLGALMPNIVYNGTHSFRAEDRDIGGLLSVISQTVTNYTDSSIFFTWLAVLDNGGHTPEQSAGMIITLTDLTTNEVVINRRYNAGDGGGGVDSRFTYQASSGLYYTSQWQLEQLTIDASRSGHNFKLTVLATDCAPTGHMGYVYLDGFGAQAPISNVPAPPGVVLFAVGAVSSAMMRRRLRAAARV